MENFIYSLRVDRNMMTNPANIGMLNKHTHTRVFKLTSKLNYFSPVTDSEGVGIENKKKKGIFSK
jgi:hypothetical protein